MRGRVSCLWEDRTVAGGGLSGRARVWKALAGVNLDKKDVIACGHPVV